jgi:Fe-S-cluster containining protein
MIDPDDYDCTKCGACCVADYDSPDYVHLLDQDLERLTDTEREQLVYVEQTFGQPQSSMKTCYDARENCRCIALKGVVGEQVSCSIYERRPNVCRNFTAGDSICDYARQAAFGVSPK